MNFSVVQEASKTSGDIINGNVVLNIPFLRVRGYKEVHVKLRAKIVTYVDWLVNLNGL